MAEDNVLTPGGYRPRSLVHKVQPGHKLDAARGRLRTLTPSGAIAADHGEIPRRPAGRPLMPGNVMLQPGVVPALGTGWIVYADWSNNTGTPVSSFATTWTVPPAPATQSGQTIFVFNGIQNSTMIYQPVLQWGPSAAGGGSYWAVASWYADGQGGQAFYSSLVQVNPGDVLVGVMTLTGQNGAAFSYDCNFQGLANTDLPIQNVDELTWCIETLEAYGLTQCSDYPNTNDTAMTNISLQTGGVSPGLTWAAVDVYTDCGQQAIVVSNANPGGEVDLYYSAVSGWHSWFRVSGGAAALGSPITVVARNPNHLDLFVTGTDGLIYSTWWDANGGWANWFNVSGGAAALGSPITAVARNPNHLDLFVTGTDGRIYSTWWDANGGWANWFNVSGGAAALGSRVEVVSRNPNHLDLFVTGTDGRIYSTWWDANGGWANWFNVSGGAAALGSPITAVARNPNHLDLFVTGTDGRIYSTWWDANGGWANWFNVSGGAAALGSPITAVARNPNHLDLFVTGTDGRIYSTWWDANGGWANWFNVSGGAAALGSRINVVARNPNHLDLFVTGTDGRIYSTWWDANGGWANWFNVSGGAAALGAPIDAIARYPDHLDLFVTGTDGGIYSTWWD